MKADQGFGGPVERRRRNLSTSAPGPNGEGDARPEKEVKRKPAKDDEDEAAQTLSDSPRTQTTAGPGAAPLSRNPSADGSPSPPPAAHQQSLDPPVTRSSLSELEVSKIINNPKLRHDINFDPELHFRPNVEGDKGRRKHDRASHFWTALREQLIEFIVDRPSFDEKHSTQDDWCLPKLLKAVKDIIQTLVPQRDRQFLDEGLNVDLLMQQFYRGIADLEKLALWLSRVLKSHCAPMRDEWVDSMYNQLSNGNRNNDVDELVNGMRSLLSVLEAMKLDVANHQIRCLRPALIEETTAFEQKFLMKKLRNRKMDIDDAKPWYRDAARTYSGNGATSSSSFGDMGIFFEGLSRSMLPSAGDKPLPGTFFFDEDRLGRVRSDILDAINLDVCMRMYEDLERIARFSKTPAFSNHASEDDPLMPSMISHEFNFNTPPSHSRPSSLALSSAGSASSSPRSSMVLPSYIVPDMNESKTKARNLRESLVALLQQAPHDHHHIDRWRAMASSMALQIFRFTNAPSEMLPQFEEKLTHNVCKIKSPMFQEIEEAYRIRLLAELATRVRYFKSLSGVCLFSIATGNRVPSNSRGLDAGRDRDLDAAIRVGQQEGGIEDIATRIAHVGVVHWRIWARMAYVDEDDMSMD
ncbi:T-complex protein 11-domain-containing protein [Dactylonectria macrodidyma]|uniref:T-complex protein 11-domain-containing protein n=1 Tax=Dactylonectria macrodidyma TaxID=307937 RepID=A0A9P9JAM7_9HYPO|nr:T-complex protein 11-domain-containing protein [Dactylonectria macrodidyma]